MSMTASQKFGMLCLPAAAVGLAVVTSGPDWSPKRTRYASLREHQMALKAGPVLEISVPVEGADPAKTPAPADPAAKKDPAVKAPAAEAKPATKSPAPAPSPAPKAADPAVPAPPAAKKEAPPPIDSGVEFRTSGLVPVRFAEPLRVPSAERLDIYVLESARIRVGTEFSDAEGAVEAIKGASAALKETGLLYVIPGARTPWESVKEIVAAGFEAGWSRVALCVSFADDAGRGRVLVLHAPTNENPEIAKGLDAVAVKIGGLGPTPAYTINGDACADPEGLAFNAKAVHEEYEVMEKDYSASVESTPWTLDPAGASAGGVIRGLDALTTAGVKAVRILGLKKPSK